MAWKRERVPEVLWRLFRNRARTLADTILALIPPPTTGEDSECRCGGRICLSCSGDRAMSFLVGPGDSADYRKLLTGCFAVVSENAPPIPPVFNPHCRWSQREIVRRSIEMIMHEQGSSLNLICCSYDKNSRSSAVVDTLTSSKWSILLKRVGDALMTYLLKYTSIFLPLPRKKYHQIVGFPISDMGCKISRRMPDSISQHSPHVSEGSRRKRNRVEGVESITGKELSTFSWDLEPSLNQITINADNDSRFSHEETLQSKLEENFQKDTVTPRKRKREFRWQRQRKRKPLVVEEKQSLLTHGEYKYNNEGLLKCGSTSSCQTPDGHIISHCFCCSVFQNEPKLKQNAEIDRQNIFYKFEASTSLLPRKHILYTVKPNDSGACILFNNIFGSFGINENPGTTSCLHRKDNCPVMSTCLYHALTKLLKSLIRGTQNCRYLPLLDKHCPVESPYKDTSRDTGTGCKGNDLRPFIFMRRTDGVQPDGNWFRVSNAKNSNKTHSDTDQKHLSSFCCPKKQVVSFIWAICRRIIPMPLLGETSNWRVLRKNISNFIRLRKYEKFSLKECIYKLRISKFHLLSTEQFRYTSNGITDIARHAILQCWMFWFFACLVSPLVQAHFYVTESEHGKQEVLYYRKSTWEKLTREAECLKNKRFCHLDHTSAKKIIGNRSFGFSRARLRPKQNGFRMLTNLQAPSRMRMDPPRFSSNRKLPRKAFPNRRTKYHYFKSVNSVLQDLHVVLKGLWTKEPEKLGSSVFDYNDVYRKLVPFLFHLKNGSTVMPSMFIVVSDVSKAFDSIDQGKLFSIISDVVSDDRYALEKFTQVTCTKKSLKVHKHVALAHGFNVGMSWKITTRLPAQALDCVLINKGQSINKRKDEMLVILKEHITRNVVLLHNKFYLQNVGIPQGSVLSSLLCSFYYGHMERNIIFPFLKKFEKFDTCEALVSREALAKKYLLLRFVDDFLFISTSKKQASMFFSRMGRGVREYNCCMNEEKYGLNFDTSNGDKCRSDRLHIGKDGISYLRWSGLFINCSTLEIQADYTRYLNTHLSCTLTVSCRGQVGRQLKSKLRCYLRPKCHPIFYNSNINSPGVVRLNIYQVFLLCAMKFVCYLKHLSSILPRLSPEFYCNAIDMSLRYMNRLLKKKMYSFDVETAFRPKYKVRKNEIVWLGLYAYCRVLGKKQSRYKELIRLLRSKLDVYGEVRSISHELKYAIDDEHSSVLWRIKY